MAKTRPAGDRAVVVAGDVILDWNFACGQGDAGRAACASFQWGGAVLLGELVDAVAKRLPDGAASQIKVHQPRKPRDVCDPSNEDVNHRFAIWEHVADKGEEKKAWRVEQRLGEQRATADVAKRTPKVAPGRADLVVLHDGDLGFRDRKDLWPRAIDGADGQRPWILLRTTKPVANGELWKRLEPFADKMIVVIHIDDLRLEPVHVTRELSWEQTAQDLLWEMLYGQEVSPLAKCAHVVVSFTTAGALLFSGTADAEGKPPATLLFDPAFMERMWNEPHRGAMIGGLSALAASIAGQVMRDTEHPDVILGVQRGVAAMRTLDRLGYDEEKRSSARKKRSSAGEKRSSGEREQASEDVRVVYPLKRIADELSGRRRPLAEVQVRGPSRSRTPATGDPRAGRDWTILEARHSKGLEALATKIVLEGSERALADVPRGRFGKLLTFDRQEIEGLQSIRTLIRQYDGLKHPSAPLSIAVFGPPGSGKSWSVTQVAGTVSDQVKSIAFNLSQFDDPKELIDAFHQVRDISLGGKLPLVFWDEFDTTRVATGELGWLPHFLSPMADGEFQDGQLKHPIGRAVFVFGGGVFDCMRAFAEASKSEKFKNVKAPDFVSRLSGYVNIVGPDPRGGDAEKDPYYLIRRAVLLRSFLCRHAPGIFRKVGRVEQQPNIDQGVLRAFLLTKEYRHGVRSLGAIIATSAVGERDRFERSDLAAEAQLDLHVDARDFLDLVHRPVIEKELLERLAEAVHVLFCARKLEAGESWEGPNDDYLLRHPLLKQYAGQTAGSKRDGAATNSPLVPYEELPAARMAAMRKQVRDTPNRLAAVGYIMRPVRSTEPLSDLVDMRCTLESAAVERAADGGDPAQLEQARAALAEMRREGITLKEFQDADVRFHVALAGASGNEAMHLMMLTVYQAVAARLLEALRRDKDSPATLHRLTKEHGALLQAIEDHQGKRAGKLVREHVTGFYQQHLAIQTR
ncbi:MAG TPA: FCD domain-containing protein [Solirubrobacteraceae bacterium]|nr:FCD domain-containing protein [Solirubrobacteraceae bacterium]